MTDLLLMIGILTLLLFVWGKASVLWHKSVVSKIIGFSWVLCWLITVSWLTFGADAPGGLAKIVSIAFCGLLLNIFVESILGIDFSKEY